jgi:hypothetical protein
MVKRLGFLKLKPVVFLHLQKTAGTSIINVARQNGSPITGDKFAQPEFMERRFGNIPFISGHFGYDFAM